MNMVATTLPDVRGRFGAYGGRYAPEVLIPALDELAAAWSALRDDPAFRGELGALCCATSSAGRRRSRTRSGSRGSSGYDIWLKREDLAHTARTRSTTRSVRPCSPGDSARSGSSPRRAPASTASRPPRRARCSGCPCVVYMGEEDTHRQAPNVARMQLLGAEVVPVTGGLEDPQGGRERGPARLGGERADHPLHHRVGRRPAPVPGAGARSPARDRRRGAGQYAERTGARPRYVLACVGGGSNAIGMFTAFVGAPGVQLIGVEAGGRGSELGRALLAR